MPRSQELLVSPLPSLEDKASNGAKNNQLHHGEPPPTLNLFLKAPWGHL